MTATATTTTDAPQAWVGCLACYNAGRLIGKWVDGIEAGALTTEDLHQALFPPAAYEELKWDVYENWPHEELWVMDHQDYRGLLSGECSPVEAQKVAEAIEKIEEDRVPVPAVASWAANIGEPVREWDAPTRESFEDAYQGEWESGAAFAEDYFESSGQFTDDHALASYVDWDRVWTGEFDCGGYWTEDNPAGGVFVFSPS